MKNLTLIIATLLLIQITATSQSLLPGAEPTQGGQACLPEGITFNTQVEIDNFQKNYPNCTEIEGDVIIDGWFPSAKITNLNGLSVLINIGGNFSIMFNDSLTSLTGLENLVSIGDDLVIRNNNALGSLTGLENLNLASIGNVYIHDNDSLTFCEVQNICSWLSSPNGSVNIYSNADGCNNPSEIATACGYILPCLPFGNYHLVSQSEIDNFENNYPGCTEIEGNIEIKGADIINLQGLNSITNIAGNFSLYSNEILTELTGLENLESIGGNLELGISPSLDVYLYNPYLNSLEGLKNLSSIGGNLSLTFNLSLTDLSGLEGLTSILGNLSMFHNPLLTNISALSNMTALGGDLRLIHHPALTSLTGMEWLTSTFGDVYIAGNDALTNLSGLDNLTSVGGKLSIEGNSDINSLSALQNLTSIGGYFVIKNLDSLTNLTGLDNIDSIGGRLLIYNNETLSFCEVQSICNYLASPNANSTIHDNAPGCNSRQEVLDSCDFSSITDYGLIQAITVHPNPFSSSTNIDYKLNKTANISMTIYNHLGKQVELIEQHQSQGMQQVVWNADEQPAGVYFCVLETEYGSQTMKMIKMKN